VVISFDLQKIIYFAAILLLWQTREVTAQSFIDAPPQKKRELSEFISDRLDLLQLRHFGLVHLQYLHWL